MKNTISYYTKEVKHFLFNSLVVTENPENQFVAKNPLQKEILNSLVKDKISTEIKEKRKDVILKERKKVEKGTGTKIEEVEKKSIYVSDITITKYIDENLLTLKSVGEKADKIKEKYTKIIKEATIPVDELTTIQSTCENDQKIKTHLYTTKISKKRLNDLSSTLLYFSGVKLDYEKGKIELEVENNKEIISFEDIIKVWNDRECFTTKNHLFIILETKSDDILNEKNEFISSLKKNYYFKNISLLICNNMNESHKFEFNNFNFIGNKLSILRDFKINLITENSKVEDTKLIQSNNKQLQMQDNEVGKGISKSERNILLNNTITTNYGNDKKLIKENKWEEKNISSIRFPNGEYYEGELSTSTGKPEGFGTKIYLDTSTYIGYFKNGDRQGRGVFIHADFTFSQMIWKNDKQSGFMLKFDNDEKTPVYEGSVVNSQYDGPGKLYKGVDGKDREIFEGIFEQGNKLRGTIYKFVKEFKGIIEIYKGGFEKNVPFGLGRVVSILDKKSLDYGVVDFYNENYLVKKGCFNVGGNEYLYKMGVNSRFWPQKIENEDNIWVLNLNKKSTKTGLCTSIRHSQYFDRINDEETDKTNEKKEKKDSFNETDKLNSNGFIGFQKMIGGDIFLGQFGSFSPKGWGVLLRKNSNSFEIGKFKSDLMDDEVLYYLENGIIIDKNKSTFHMLNFFSTQEDEYYENLISNKETGITYLGRGYPVYEVITKEKENEEDDDPEPLINKNILKGIRKIDIKAKFYDSNSKSELFAVIKTNEDGKELIISGVLHQKNKDNTENVYNGCFNENKEFHGYGILDFGNHPQYKRYKGEFKNGCIEGFGELIYKNKSVEKGIFSKLDTNIEDNLLNKKSEDFKLINVDNNKISKDLYEVVGKVNLYFPTLNEVYINGFSIQQNFIFESFITDIPDQADKKIKRKKQAFGYYSYSYDTDKEMFILNSGKNNNLIFIKRLVNEFLVVAIVLDDNMKIGKMNIVMKVDSVYKGTIDLNTYEPNGYGKIKERDGSWYIGDFINGKFHGVGKYLKWKVLENDKEVKYPITQVSYGTFVEGLLHGDLCFREFRWSPKPENEPLIKGEFKREYGEFKQGHLIKGVKQVLNLQSVTALRLIAGKFHVKKINPLKFFDDDETTEFSKPVCKGIHIIKNESSVHQNAFGGKIIESIKLKGHYSLWKDGIKFYQTKTPAGKKWEYKILMISQYDEFKLDKINWDDCIRVDKEIINGKGRLYRIDKIDFMDNKSNRNDLDDKQLIFYEGDFKNGSFEGKGIINYDNGEIFIGDIERSDLDIVKPVFPKKGNFGTIIQPLVGTQTGFFEDQKLTGRAVIVYQNGIKYKGEMNKGKANGKGLIFFPDGTHYDGLFKNDRMFGPSNFYYNDGNCLKCTLDNNSNINGNGVYTFSDGKTIINGQFVNNLMYGSGTLRKDDGMEISGGLQNFEPRGTVSITFDIKVTNNKIEKTTKYIAYGNVNETKNFEGKIVNTSNGASTQWKGPLDKIKEFQNTKK